MVTPTPLDARARATADRLIAQRGRSLLLRKRTRVEVKTGVGIGGVVTSPLSSSALLVNGALSAGVPMISLRSSGLTGLLVAGDGVLIGGALYTVSGGPYQPDASGHIVGVAITPALASPAADGDSAQVRFTGTDFPVKGVVESFSLALTASTDSDIQSGDIKVTFASAALDRLGIAITTQDELYNGPDTSYRRGAIREIMPIPSGELDALVTVRARMAR